MVVVDEPAEEIPAANVSGADRYRVPWFGEREGEGEGPMGPRAVVVFGTGPECSIEMPPPKNE